MSEYSIYCDGAYSFSRKTSGSGVVIIKDGKIITKFYKKFEKGTNNTAELCAVILAMRSFKAPIDKVIIYSDSMYIIGTINEGWNRKKNKKLWEEFDNSYEYLKKLCPDITFIWVKGHNTGDIHSYYNNIADELAVFATQSI